MSNKKTNRTRTTQGYLLRLSVVCFVGLFFLLVLQPAAANGATITVTTTADETVTNDAPSVSLREAIISFNNQADTGADVTANRVGAYGVNDTINFNIPGGGVKTINLGSSLPTIIRPVTINGYTQGVATVNTLANADNAVILIQLDGAGAGTAVNGLTLGLGSGGSTIKGLDITNFQTDANFNGGVGILAQSDGNTIVGNFVGVNPAGTAQMPNGGDGIRIVNASNSVIGTSAPADRNIASGNILDGIHIVGSLTLPAIGNLIRGNFVGVAANGVSRVGVRTAPIPNAGALSTDAGNFLFGIEISGGNGNTVGGTVAGARNVVGFNADGIEVDNGGQFNTIQGNFSGVGADGVTPVKNLQHGIALRSSNTFGPPFGPAQPNEPGVSFNLIGGTVAGAGNLVEFNGTGGIAVFGNPVSASGQPNIANTIEGNSIFENGRTNSTVLLGIDLTNQFKFPTDDGVTPNDSQGHGAQNDPNNFQNFPVLTAALPNSGKTDITGTLKANANSTYRIEFFASDPDPLGLPAEGQQFLGFANVTTDANGNVTFSVTLNVPVANGRVVTATATDAVGNTSEFSAGIVVPFQTPPPAISINNVAVVEGNSGSTNAVFTVTLSPASTQTVTVDYFTSNGTATAPSDYQSVNGTLTFSPGVTTRTISVPVNGDTTPEADETFFVNLTNASNAVIVGGLGVGTILNDDPGGTMQFSAASYSVPEISGPAVITVTRTGSTIGTVTVNYATSNGTATAGVDYGNTSGTLSFGTGETSKTFNVPILDDNANEGTQIFNLTLSGPTGGATLGAQSAAVVSILEEEPAPPPDLFAVTINNNLLRLNANAPEVILSTVAISGLQPSENILAIDFRPATGQLYALGSTSRLYTIDPTTAVATQVGSAGLFTLTGTDFGSDFDPTVDRLRVISDAKQNIRINPNDGSLAGTDTNLAFASGDPNFGANPNVTASAYTNNFAGAITTTLYGIDSNLDVLVRQGGVDGTPSPNGGQLSTIGSLGVNTTGLAGLDIRPTNNTAYASLTAPGDTSSKLYTINLSTGAATLIGAIGGSILIRDIAVVPAGSFQFSTSTATVSEGAGKVTVTVTRTGDTTGTATVNVNTADGTATQKGDYTIRRAIVTFGPGETSKTVDVFITDDVFIEGSETFTINLTNPTGDFSLDGTSTMTVTITDNDSNPAAPNPIDSASFFVRQHYIDFLNREPDPPGLAAWVSTLNGCAPGDTSCDRIHVSEAFFRSQEFQQRGFFVYRFYPVSFGRKPDYSEFMPDIQRVSGFLDATQLEAAKVAFIAEFMARPGFANTYNGLNNTQYVDTLLSTAGVTLLPSPSTRQALIDGLNNSTLTRAQVLRQIAESNEVSTKFFNQAFVVMEYFGYLRRDPDALFLNWITVLNTTGDSRGMVNGFMNSLEYRQRFGPQ